MYNNKYYLFFLIFPLFIKIYLLLIIKIFNLKKKISLN